MNIQHKRQGQMELQDVYFYTDTIIDFKHFPLLVCVFTH